MKKLGITEGDWVKNGKNGIHNELGENICVTNPLSEKCITDADFIADAGTTANKCGLLPSELLKQRDEALTALKALVDDYGGGEKFCGHNYTCSCSFDLAKKSIQKITRP